MPHTRKKIGSTNLPEGTVHVFRDGSGKPTPEEFETKVEQMSLAETIDEDSDGIMLGVLAVPSWMTPSDFLDFVAPAVDGISHLRIIRCVNFLMKNTNCILISSELGILLRIVRSSSSNL